MAVPKTRMFRLVLILSFFAFFYSCDNENQNEQYLLNSIELSNEIYESNISKLREFFESKFNEEPIKYKSTNDKISYIETEINKYFTLTSTEEKKLFIERLKKEFEKLSQIDNLEFVCLSINNNLELFDLIAENDFKRNLNIIYIEFYKYHHSVF